MKEEWLENEMQHIAAMEAHYRWVAELVKPSELEEDPTRSARSYLLALRGLERCVELRLKLIRAADRLPEAEEAEPLATVDLSRLSTDALEEVEAALVPVSASGVQDKTKSAPPDKTKPAPPNEPKKEDDSDRERLCETRRSAARTPQRKRTTPEAPRVGRRSKSPSSG